MPASWNRAIVGVAILAALSLGAPSRPRRRSGSVRSLVERGRAAARLLNPRGRLLLELSFSVVGRLIGLVPLAVDEAHAFAARRARSPGVSLPA